MNLISNAKHAMEQNPKADKRLVLGIAAGNDGFVQVSVADNGVGIAPENLTRVFNHGFTTKKNGHGFGLHSGANAASGMGGTLIAKSEGLGRGATFVLELPTEAIRGPHATDRPADSVSSEPHRFLDAPAAPLNRGI
jgi:signal transduction histidine kinase